jgi:acyl-CoA synthetase (AMP-forming)/AMP-acid ligase II
MLESPSFAARDLSSLDMICYGAAPAPLELLHRMASGFKSRLCHVYGTTETMCSLYQPSPLDKPDRLAPGFYSTLRVVRNGGGTGDTVSPGEEGELLIDATVGMIFTEYLDRPEVTAEKLVDGWYRTGDVVLLNDDGSVTLKGRADDIIRSAAENVHPAEVEAVLASHPGVADVAVVGIPDARWGELVVACVVCRTPAPSAQELDAHCRSSTLAGYKRPRAYFKVAALPRNAANKVLRRDLRASVVAARDQGDARYCSDLSKTSREAE